jgi:hypothetical protein
MNHSVNIITIEARASNDRNTHFELASGGFETGSHVDVGRQIRGVDFEARTDRTCITARTWTDQLNR